MAPYPFDAWAGCGPRLPRRVVPGGFEAQS